jgi:hypothetical protein
MMQSFPWIDTIGPYEKQYLSRSQRQLFHLICIISAQYLTKNEHFGVFEEPLIA